MKESGSQVEATTARVTFHRQFFSLIFYIHLFLISIFVIFLVISGFRSSSQTHQFHQEKWFPPLLSSIASAGIISFIWQGFTRCYPSKAFKLAFRFTPVLSLVAGAFFLSIGSGGGLAAGVTLIVSAIILSLYVCWVNPRFVYSIQILSNSIAFPPKNTTVSVILSIVMGIFYTSFMVLGIGGAIAARSRYDPLYIAILLLSLAWTTQVIKTIMQVSISCLKYTNFVYDSKREIRETFINTVKNSFGTITTASVVIPAIDFIWGTARAMNVLLELPDEFLFSCAKCYSGIASNLIGYGNKWGLVHVGVFNKGFLKASNDTWMAFLSVGLSDVIDSDLTSSFCFLCGISTGAISSITSGIWACIIHKNYATEISIYAFLIGYLLCGIGMAWPQACVAAYYVAYTDIQDHSRFDSTIPDRVRALQSRTLP